MNTLTRSLSRKYGARDCLCKQTSGSGNAHRELYCRITRAIVGLAVIFFIADMMVGCSISSPRRVAYGYQGRWPKFKVKTVADGDTLTLEDGREVRYAGINAPEMAMPYYSQARLANCQLVEGRNITLRFDVRKRGRYGRMLAYVYVDDIFVNERLVRHGLAYAHYYLPNTRYRNMLQAAEQKAREERIGIWKRSTLWGQVEITHIKFDARGNDNKNLNGEWVEISNTTGDHIDMTGFTLSDDANHLFKFPNFLLPGHTSIKIFTGSGMDTESSLYWGWKGAIWNNDGDRAYLRNADGLLTDEHSYRLEHKMRKWRRQRRNQN